MWNFAPIGCLVRAQNDIAVATEKLSVEFCWDWYRLEVLNAPDQKACEVNEGFCHPAQTWRGGSASLTWGIDVEALKLRVNGSTGT